MNAELHAGKLGGSPFAPSTSQSTSPPRRPIAVLIILALIALGLMILPRPTLYYPNVIIDADGGMQLEFLLNGRQDKTACESAAAAIANAIQAGCPDCRARRQACLANPPAELRRRFDETPLPVPSARMADGIITYSAQQADMALLACQESEHQAALRGDQTKVTCYPAGAVRPHTAFEKSQDQTAHTTFTLLLAIVGGLIASLIAAILITHARQRRHPMERSAPPATPVRPEPFGYAQDRPVEAHGLVHPTHPWLEKLTLAGVDTLILLGVFLALSWPATDDINRWSRLDRATVIGHGVVIVLTIGWFWLLLEHYARRRPFWDELREIFRVLAVMFMVSGAAAFVAGLETGRGSHLIVWALNFLLIPLGRAGARQLLDDLGLWQRPAVIVGTGENARDAYLAINSERGMGYHILGFIKVGPNDEPAPSTGGSGQSEGESLTIGAETFPIFAPTTSLESLLAMLGTPQIILALDSLTDTENQTLVQRLLAVHRNIHIVPSLRGLPLFGTQISHFFSHEVLFLTVRNNLSRRGPIWIKRLFDLVATSLLLVLLSPLFLVLSLLIRRSGGTAFYGHTRVGRDGKPFKCIKFRSMRPDADKVLKDLLENDPAARAEWDQDFKLKNDPRITPVGHFLRRTSLDELPQLINVVKGEMSLVGPRPIVTDELERYGDYVSLYLQVLPGVTGLWQVSGRNDTSYAERVSLDAWYVQNWSLWYDIAILFKTVGVVFNKRGAY